MIDLRPVRNDDPRYDICGNTAHAILEVNNTQIPLCSNCLEELTGELEKFNKTTFCYKCSEFIMSQDGWNYGGSCKRKAAENGVELSENLAGYSYCVDCMGTCDRAKPKEDTGMKIEDLGLSARAYNVLKRARIDTVEQLQQLSDDDLLCLRNMGVGTLKEIREKVEYVKTMTNADRIRRMSDEELGQFIISISDDGWPFACKNKPECQNGVPAHGLCNKCFREWLQKPAEETKPPAIFEDKQESGLLED